MIFLIRLRRRRFMPYCCDDAALYVADYCCFRYCYAAPYATLRATLDMIAATILRYAAATITLILPLSLAAAFAII